jgi:hypothetical protein
VVVDEFAAAIGVPSGGKARKVLLAVVAERHLTRRLFGSSLTSDWDAKMEISACCIPTLRPPCRPSPSPSFSIVLSAFLQR